MLFLIKIKKIKINYINFFNKLVLNKNLLNFKKNNNVFIKINHKKNTNKIVTLRAPKHFKIGRNHYSIITNKIFFLFKLNINYFKIKNNSIYNFIKNFNSIILKKQQPRALNLISQIKLTYLIKKKFNVV